MTIEKARNILKIKDKKFTDKEIQKIIDLVQDFVRLYLDKNNV